MRDAESVAGQRSTLEEWLQWLETLHPKKIDLSLERIRTVIAALQLEEPPYSVITVGGTNGKGSCVAFLESIYREAGFRVGAYTSPHLVRFNERLRFAGADATNETVVELFEIIDEARGEITLSYFEYATLAALVHFARSQADVAVLEVGLGGRLDAVNAVDADVCLVVSIALDHQGWLGTTLEAIGYEKAGIMRPRRPAVIAERHPPESLLAHAARVGADLLRIGRDFDGEAEGGQWVYRGRDGSRTGLPRPAFGGAEQIANAAGCLAVVDSLAHRLPVTADALVRGLASARLGARVERREIAGVQWVFDVAHNPAAAAALARELARTPVAGRTYAVVAVMGDKDFRGVLAPLVPLVDEWLATRVSESRGASAEALVAALGEGVVADVCEDVASACERVRNEAVAGDRVLVYGSFYLVGPVMSALGLYCAPSQTGERAATKWTGV